VQPRDIALLTPGGTDLWRYERALEERGITVAAQAGKGFFRRQEVQDLIALARVLADRQDTLALGALLRGPLAGATDEELLDAVAAQALKPERFLQEPHRYEPLRAKVNWALAFAGLEVNAQGLLEAAEVATTIPEAERRARDVREDLVRRGVHPDVLAFCRAELLVDNFFHAVLEAVKSVGDKLRARTGLTDDGALLVDRALGGDLPMLAVNSFHSQDERSEQRGFANLVRGTYGMFRNPKAHAPKVYWSMSREDAENLFSLVFLIHRRLDRATMPPWV
jgi:uncharacterized protein (TIGR02391 family)